MPTFTRYVFSQLTNYSNYSECRNNYFQTPQKQKINYRASAGEISQRPDVDDIHVHSVSPLLRANRKKAGKTFTNHHTTPISNPIQVSLTSCYSELMMMPRFSCCSRHENSHGKPMQIRGLLVFFWLSFGFSPAQSTKLYFFRKTHRPNNH